MTNRAFSTVCSIVLVAATAACNSKPSLDAVPVGTNVAVVRTDGGVVKGSLEKAEPTAVVVRDAGKSRTIPRKDIADVQVATPGEAAQPLPPSAKFHEVLVPSTTMMAVRLLSPLDSKTGSIEEAVRAELAEPIRIDDVTVVPAGAHLTGVVTRAVPSGKVKGRAELAFTLSRLQFGSDEYQIEANYAREAEGTKSSDAKKIGVPAAGGAILGGILGGKKGAVIGGVVGGGAGTAVVLTTPGKEVTVAAGTVLRMAIGRDVDVKVPVKFVPDNK